MNSTFSEAVDTAAPQTFTMISYGIIDCRLKGIYKNLNKGKNERAAEIINDTIRSIKGAKESECDPKFVDYVLCQLYMMLLDIGFKRPQEAHVRLRNMHYEIYNICDERPSFGMEMEVF